MNEQLLTKIQAKFAKFNYSVTIGKPFNHAQQIIINPICKDYLIIDTIMNSLNIKPQQYSITQGIYGMQTYIFMYKI